SDTHTEPDIGRIKKIVAIDHAEINTAAMVFCDHLKCFQQIAAHAERAGQIVGGTQWQNGKRQLMFIQRRCGGADSTVATAEDNQVDSWTVLTDQLTGFISTVGCSMNQADACCFQQRITFLHISGAAGAAIGIYYEECSPRCVCHFYARNVERVSAVVIVFHTVMLLQPARQ